MKRRLFKTSLIIISTLVILVLVVALIISPVTKNYVVKHSKELIGRKVQIHDLHINIFTGTLEIDSMCLFEKNDKDIFVAVDTFFLNLTLNKLLSKKLEISELKIIHPYMDVLQKGNVFNFDDLFPKKDTKKQASNNFSFPKSIIIKDIYMKGGLLIYTDQVLKNTIKMNDLGLSIPELSFGGGNTKGGIHLKIGDKATIDSKLAINMTTNEFKFNLMVKNLAINIFKPYIQEYYNVKQLEGLINGNLLLVGNTNHIIDFKLNGTGSASKFKMTNSIDEPVASAETVTMKMNKIFYKTSTYLFEFIHGTNVRLNYILNPKTNNFSVLFKPENNTKTTGTPPMIFKIKDLHIENSQMEYVDNTLNSQYKLPINKIDFLAKNFDMNGNNEFKINGSFPDGGFVDFSWKGNLNDVSTQIVMLKLQNLKLKLVSPYCKYFTAYEITNGNMNFESRNNIRNNRIQSSNIVDIYKINVGKKNKKMKVKYNVPLRLALYILKDKDDKINFDLPVKGNIRDPQFSYKKIIFKTFTNLLVKVALSPVKFLAGTLGFNPEKMEAIPVEPLQSNLTAEQYSQINNLATIIKKKPDMVLTLTQFVNIKETLPEYALYKTKYSYLNSNRIDSDSIVSQGFEDIQQLNNSDPDFVEYIDSLLNIKAMSNKNSSVMEKAISLYLPDSLQKGLLVQLENRNSILKKYMITTCEIPEKNLVIKTADKDTLLSYKEKARYKIEMTLPGVEKLNQ